MSASGRLRRKIELVLAEYAAPGRLLLAHPEAAEVYPRYLEQLYALPLTAVALMEAAAERARTLRDDPVCDGLVRYLERHIDEEAHGGSPGEGLLADLDALGVDSEAVSTRLPPAKMAALVGAQYFWIRHAHPVTLLGFLAVIEGFHPRREAVERLIERTGLPRGGFGQLLEHAELDIGHSAELDLLLDTLPLTGWHEELLGISAFQTVELVTDALVDVLRHGERGHESGSVLEASARSRARDHRGRLRPPPKRPADPDGAQ